MKRFIVLFYFVVVAAPLHAEPMNDELCQGVFDRLRSLNDPIVSGVKDSDITFINQPSTDEWCSSIVHIATPKMEAHISEISLYNLTWTGTGLQEFAESGTPPQRLEVKVRQVIFGVPKATSLEALIERVKRVNVKLSATLVASYDPKRETLDIEKLLVEAIGENSILVSASFSEVDFTQPDVFWSRVKLSNLAFTFKNYGFYENYIFPTLARRSVEVKTVGQPAWNNDAFPWFFGGDTTSGLIYNLPNATASEDTKRALNNMNINLPSLSGEISVEIDADGGLGLARMLTLANVLSDDVFPIEYPDWMSDIHLKVSFLPALP